MTLWIYGDTKRIMSTPNNKSRGYQSKYIANDIPTTGYRNNKMNTNNRPYKMRDNRDFNKRKTTPNRFFRNDQDHNNTPRRVDDNWNHVNAMRRTPQVVQPYYMYTQPYQQMMLQPNQTFFGQPIAQQQQENRYNEWTK